MIDNCIEFGLAVWFCSGQELPAHPCSLAWIRAGRAEPEQNQHKCAYIINVNILTVMHTFF